MESLLETQFKKMKESICPFCNPDSDRTILLENEYAFAMLDKFPVNEGHTLIIPKRHTADYFDLSTEEQSHCWFMLNKAKLILVEKFNPDGFNVGINVGELAGQTIHHIHLHLIPRYKGDVEDPAGGVRHIIPGKGYY